MKVLIVGSGGREHCLAWKISQSSGVDKIYSAPGNAGTAMLGENVEIATGDIKGLVKFAEKERIDLTLVGPEAPLVSGIVDEFQKRNLKVFGPGKELALLEGSKVFAKETMKRFNIPTADFKIFDDASVAKEYIRKKGTPLVVKADGLAAGKGVIVCASVDEAILAVKLIMEDKEFGSAGEKVIIEDCLVGEETSIIAFTDGKTILPLASSQDHKRIFDQDKGPNTGGMGAYSPAPVVTQKIWQQTEDKIFKPLIQGLARENKFYAGILYVGLMITENGPEVLEFNVRFGDPETQAILPRLRNDLVDIIEATLDRRLEDIKLSWDRRDCLCVVVASGGYPGSYEKGKEIFGLSEAARLPDVFVFHAGTTLKENKIFTSGGRVLNISALGQDIRQAQDKTYQAIERINFDQMYCRRDIGYRAIERLAV